jgi:hypothetical protein
MDPLWGIWLAGIYVLALYMLVLAYRIWRRHHDRRISVALSIGAGLMVAGSGWVVYASALVQPNWPKLAIGFAGLLLGIGLYCFARWLRDRVVEQPDVGERHPLLGAVVGGSGGLSFIAVTSSLIYIFSP